MSRPLRTLHVTTIDLTAYCFLRSWFRYLGERGAEVTLACTVEQFRDEIEATGAEVLHVPIARSVSPIRDLASFMDLVYLMQRLKPDLVHTHTSKAGFLGRLAARMAGVPLVVHTIHELPGNSAASPLMKGLYWAYEWTAARAADHLVTVSEANRRQIMAQGICLPRKLTLVREGIELDRYRAERPPAEVRRGLGIPEDAPVVGCVARLEAAKGHRDLLEAFDRVLARVPEAWLVCVGKGDLHEELVARADAMGLGQRVLFTGFRYDMLDLVEAFDVFALASRYEGLGIALLEAMAMRKPVVCTRVGGTQDVVVDGETGYFVPPEDPEAMAERIVELLSDRARARAFGEAGRRRVEAEFDDAEANRRMHGLYRHLLQTHGVHVDGRVERAPV